jgi:hypothetical protein
MVHVVMSRDAQSSPAGVHTTRIPVAAGDEPLAFAAAPANTATRGAEQQEVLLHPAVAHAKRVLDTREAELVRALVPRLDRGDPQDQMVARLLTPQTRSRQG